MEERKRKREQEIEEEEKATIEKEWQKNFEVKYVNCPGNCMEGSVFLTRRCLLLNRTSELDRM
jgi:hypothetical protein